MTTPGGAQPGTLHRPPFQVDTGLPASTVTPPAGLLPAVAIEGVPSLPPSPPSPRAAAEANGEPAAGMATPPRVVAEAVRREGGGGVPTPLPEAGSSGMPELAVGRRGTPEAVELAACVETSLSALW